MKPSSPHGVSGVFPGAEPAELQWLPAELGAFRSFDSVRASGKEGGDGRADPVNLNSLHGHGEISILRPWFHTPALSQPMNAAEAMLGSAGSAGSKTQMFVCFFN